MEYRALGRTGLQVSVMGLGCGGHSRLGLAHGKGEENAIAVVRRALDIGVNIIDTAESYGTEEAVGKGIAGRDRRKVVLCTKAGVSAGGARRTAADLRVCLEASLRRLQTDYVDVYHLHGVILEEYDYAVAELVPEMMRMRDEGKIRFLGITERFAADPGHAMLQRALEDDWFDVVMVGFNMINQSASERVFSITAPRGIGTLCMFAVRRALSSPEAVRELVADLRHRGYITEDLDPDAPLSWTLLPNLGASLPDVAYRFCRQSPGLDVILSGTGDIAHLEENARSLHSPPLPPSLIARLQRVFGRVDCVSGD